MHGSLEQKDADTLFFSSPGPKIFMLVEFS